MLWNQEKMNQHDTLVFLFIFAANVILISNVSYVCIPICFKIRNCLQILNMSENIESLSFIATHKKRKLLFLTPNTEDILDMGYILLLWRLYISFLHVFLVP